MLPAITIAAARVRRVNLNFMLVPPFAFRSVVLQDRVLGLFAQHIFVETALRLGQVVAHRGAGGGRIARGQRVADQTMFGQGLAPGARPLEMRRIARRTSAAF